MDLLSQLYDLSTKANTIYLGKKGMIIVGPASNPGDYFDKDKGHLCHDGILFIGTGEYAGKFKAFKHEENDKHFTDANPSLINLNMVMTLMKHAKYFSSSSYELFNGECSIDLGDSSCDLESCEWYVNLEMSVGSDSFTLYTNQYAKYLHQYIGHLSGELNMEKTIQLIQAWSKAGPKQA